MTVRSGDEFKFEYIGEKGIKSPTYKENIHRDRILRSECIGEPQKS